MKNIQAAARASSIRESLRFGLVTDKKLAKKLKHIHGSNWFTSGAISTLIVKRFDGQIFTLDLIEESSQLSAWDIQFFVNKRSLIEVPLGTSEVFRIHTLIKQQVIMAMVDFSSKDKEIGDRSRKMINKDLNDVAPSLYKGLLICYLDRERATRWMKRLGIEEDLHPFPYLHYVEHTSTQVAYFYNEKHGDIMRPDNIRQWAQKIIEG